MFYSIEDFNKDSKILAKKIAKDKIPYDGIFGVPKGGVPLAMKLSNLLNIPVVDTFEIKESHKFGLLVVDDVVDSGKTREFYEHNNFACLHVKSNLQNPEGVPDYFIADNIDEWISYWWEGEEQPAEDAVTRMIQAIGDDPNREGMKDTPQRVIKSWGQLFCGYEGDPQERIAKMMTEFSKDGYDELVLLKDIEFFSFCEHHLLPFFGKAHIAYIPNEKVVGISKLARLLDIHSRRFQIQERIGELVTKDIMNHLKAKGAACIIEAQHLCMKMRGVSKQHSVMTTSSMKGAFLEKPAARAELMSLIK